MAATVYSYSENDDWLSIYLKKVYEAMRLDTFRPDDMLSHTQLQQSRSLKRF